MEKTAPTVASHGYCCDIIGNKPPAEGRSVDPSTLTTPMSSNYVRRHGTGKNYGFEYEDQMIAYLALTSANQEDMKTFWIASNVDGLGTWDDIVLYNEYINRDKSLKFLQLKHATLNLRSFEKDIKKCANDFGIISSELNKHPTQYENIKMLKETMVRFEDIEFILMTNAKFKQTQNFSNVSKTRNSLIMTNLNGPTYGISPLHTIYENEIEFKKQFTLITEQHGVNDYSLINSIEIQLRRFIADVNFDYYLDVAKCLPTALNEWFLSEKRTLSITDLREIVSSCMLSALRFTKPINNNCPILNEDTWKIFQRLIKNYQLVVFTNSNLILKNLFNEHNTHDFISWEGGNIDFPINCIKAAKNMKVILFAPNATINSNNIKQISTLNLANQVPQELLELLEDYTIQIQGRKTKFGTLLKLYPSTKNIFTVDDIFKLLLNKLSIGGSYDVPELYVSRIIPRIFINKSIIYEMSTSFFILIVETNLIESDYKINSYMESKYASTKNVATNEKNYVCVEPNTLEKTKLNLKKEFESIHILKYHRRNNDFQLEWKSSTGDLHKVRNFRKKETNFAEITDNFGDLPSNNKVLIVANPGMGKTSLIKHWANNYSVDLWVIFVSLNELNFETTDNFQSYLEMYTKKLSLRDENIFDLYLKNKSVVVLFDGFDEIAPYHEQEALSLINGASEQQLRIVVTSRKVMKIFLENNLNVLAHTLNRFTKTDKAMFLERFYMQKVYIPDSLNKDVIKNKIKEFSLKLLGKCRLSNWDQKFTCVPLQCRLMAEGFIEECRCYCKTGDINYLPKNLNIIALYENLIEKNFNIFITEKGKVKATEYLKDEILELLKEKFLREHMEAAVQIIFPQVVIKDSEKFLEKIKTAKEKHGIISGVDENNKPVFIHRIFAEFFAAKWLVEVLKKNLFESEREEYLKLLLEPENSIVQDLFDRMMCKDCELHIAVLNADVNEIEKILNKNGGHDDAKCGRSALHLIASRGAQHYRKQQITWDQVPFFKIVKRESPSLLNYLSVLHLLLVKAVWKMDEQDTLLRWSPQQYATHRCAFGVIDMLLEHEITQLYNLENSFPEDWTTEEISDMVASYNYAQLAKKLIQCKRLNFQDGTISSFVTFYGRFLDLDCRLFR